jgi:MtN3 and saliva related transmembrane protein
MLNFFLCSDKKGPLMIFKTVGILAAILTSTGFIPQIIKALTIKEMKDISIVMLVIVVLGTFLWTIYGISIKDPIVIISNTITCLSVIFLLVLKKIYNGNNKKHE